MNKPISDLQTIITIFLLYLIISSTITAFSHFYIQDKSILGTNMEIVYYLNFAAIIALFISLQLQNQWYQLFIYLICLGVNAFIVISDINSKNKIRKEKALLSISNIIVLIILAWISLTRPETRADISAQSLPENLSGQDIAQPSTSLVDISGQSSPEILSVQDIPKEEKLIESDVVTNPAMRSCMDDNETFGKNPFRCSQPLIGGYLSSLSRRYNDAYLLGFKNSISDFLSIEPHFLEDFYFGEMLKKYGLPQKVLKLSKFQNMSEDDVISLFNKYNFKLVNWIVHKPNLKNDIGNVLQKLENCQYDDNIVIQQYMQPNN